MTQCPKVDWKSLTTTGKKGNLWCSLDVKRRLSAPFCAQHIAEWVGVIVPEGTIHLHNVTRHVDPFDFSLVASSTLHLLPQHTVANRVAATNTESKQPEWMILALKRRPLFLPAQTMVLIFHWPNCPPLPGGNGVTSPFPLDGATTSSFVFISMSSGS